MLVQLRKKTVVNIAANDICTTDGEKQAEVDTAGDSEGDPVVQIVSDDDFEEDSNEIFLISDDELAMDKDQMTIKKELETDENYASAIAKGLWVEQQKAALLIPPTDAGTTADKDDNETFAAVVEQDDDTEMIADNKEDEVDPGARYGRMEDEAGVETGMDDEGASSSGGVEGEGETMVGGLDKNNKTGEWMVKVETELFEQNEEGVTAEESKVREEDDESEIGVLEADNMSVTAAGGMAAEDNTEDEEKSNSESDSNDSIAISTPDNESDEDL